MGSTPERGIGSLRRLLEGIRRAFVEFLTLPVMMVGGFLLLAAGTTALDHSHGGWLEPLRATLRELLLRNAQATGDLLATIAGSIITLTSITFSLLLLAVQQAAGTLTPEIYDQFLRRRTNQVYFGFFVGLAVYALIILASVDPPYNPVFGAAFALLLTIVSLMFLIVLLYETINEMRPVVVIETIHDRILRARDHQLSWMKRTRPTAQLPPSLSMPVSAERHGYITRLDVDALESVARKVRGEVEVVIPLAIGSYVATNDVLATVRAASREDAEEVAGVVKRAISIEQQRDLDTDAAYGIEQLTIIGWTSVSTAKSNPEPGLLVIRELRDVLALWSEGHGERDADATAQSCLPVVYTDNVFARLLDAFETLTVVASESMQSQTMAELARTFAVMFGRLPAPAQDRVEDLIRRSLSALGEHVLTYELNAALIALVEALDSAGRSNTAAEVGTARSALALSVGKLGSRATRVHSIEAQ